MADLTTKLSVFLEDLWAGTLGATIALTTGVFTGQVSAGSVVSSGAVSGTTGTFTGNVSRTGANAQATVLSQATALLATTTGALTETQADLIPAGSLVLGVTIRVTSAVSGAGLGTMSIGDGTDADRWGTGIALAAGTTTTIADFTISSPVYYAAATGVVLTGNAGQFDAGAVRLTVHYLSLTAATS